LYYAIMPVSVLYEPRHGIYLFIFTAVKRSMVKVTQWVCMSTGLSRFLLCSKQDQCMICLSVSVSVCDGA